MKSLYWKGIYKTCTTMFIEDLFMTVKRKEGKGEEGGKKEGKKRKKETTQLHIIR